MQSAVHEWRDTKFVRRNDTTKANSTLVKKGKSGWNRINFTRILSSKLQ